MFPPSRTLENMASKANLTVPAVRYWAETRGQLLGIHRDAAGEWHFSPAAKAFLIQLGRQQEPAAPPTPSPGSGIEAQETDAPPKMFGNASGADAPPPGADAPPPVVAQKELTALRHELQKLAGAVRRLEQRHDGADARTDDLAEEMKQMQILLSRVMDMMTPLRPPGERPRVVRPWRPPRA